MVYFHSKSSNLIVTIEVNKGQFHIFRFINGLLEVNEEDAEILRTSDYNHKLFQELNDGNKPQPFEKVRIVPANNSKDIARLLELQIILFKASAKGKGQSLKKGYDPILYEEYKQLKKELGL